MLFFDEGVSTRSTPRLVVHDFLALRRRQAVIIGQMKHIARCANSIFIHTEPWRNPVLRNIDFGRGLKFNETSPLVPCDL
jgi:hypothetical protein